MKKVRVGSRDSRLAVIQAEMVMEAIRRYDPEIQVELITMKTTGDKILDRTLDQIGGKGLFVKELDLALAQGEVDITVHSFKDLPMEENEALPIVALGKREDPRDVLILSREEFEEGSPIGCSSLRRRLQLRQLFPDQGTAPVRGNLQTRLKKLDSGEYSGLVLAAAGVKRLCLEERISRYFSTEEILPAACQGIIAVQGRRGENTDYLKLFDDPDSHIAAEAERGFVRELDGGCSSPVAAYCTLSDGNIHLEGLYYDEASDQGIKGSSEGKPENAAELGRELARRLRAQAHPEEEKDVSAAGSVALVGAGPGDPGLFTLKGAELLAKADVVVYDRLVSDEILRMMPESAEKINVGKESSHHPVPQDEINRILLRKAQEGHFVVRLKGGDPFVFGRGGEELELLAENGISFEVVPGITSAIAASCYAGIPVTHRDFCSSFHVITGHARAGKELSIPYETLVKLEGTLVFLMGVSALPHIVQGLLDAGMKGGMPAAVVENGTRPGQRKVVSTLAELRGEAEREAIHSPAIIVVGKVCGLSDQFDWFMHRPLFGRQIVVTRPRNSEGTLSSRLSRLGAEVLEYPCIEIHPVSDRTPLKMAISEIGKYGWLLFSSKNGVEVFFDTLNGMGLDCRALAGLRIGAVGSQTAQELFKWGIRADCVPEKFDGEHLGQAVAAMARPHERALICDALISAGGLAGELGKAGIAYDRIPLYETTYPESQDTEVQNRIRSGEAGFVVFTSASGVEGFAHSLAGMDFSRISAICIGEQTAAAALQYGMSCRVAKKASMDSLMEEIIQTVK